ncbi:hypothetical protein ACFQ3B_26375 [Stackebrandtia endophytica]|nr:hypothetical protein [Stackebrandtia endophytica]
MQRRQFLMATAATSGLAVTGMPPKESTPTIDEVMFGRFDVEGTAGRRHIAAQLAAAKTDLRATRYAELITNLPRLLANATATAEATTGTMANRYLAQAYCVAAQTLIRLHDDARAAACADRALHAARRAGDPVIAADAVRLVSTVVRRGPGAESAGHMILTAAQDLNDATGLPGADDRAMYTKLFAVAAYTAALADDADTATAALAEADAVCTAHTEHSDVFTAGDLATYRISVARRLGDFGTAIRHSRATDPNSFATCEQVARYWQDTAISWQQRGRYDQAFAALWQLENKLPQEVRYRPWAKELTTELISATNHREVREFAARIGVQ